MKRVIVVIALVGCATSRQVVAPNPQPVLSTIAVAAPPVTMAAPPVTVARAVPCVGSEFSPTSRSYLLQCSVAIRHRAKPPSRGAPVAGCGDFDGGLFGYCGADRSGARVWKPLRRTIL